MLMVDSDPYAGCRLWVLVLPQTLLPGLTVAWAMRSSRRNPLVMSSRTRRTEMGWCLLNLMRMDHDPMMMVRCKQHQYQHQERLVDALRARRAAGAGPAAAAGEQLLATLRQSQLQLQRLRSIRGRMLLTTHSHRVSSTVAPSARCSPRPSTGSLLRAGRTGGSK
jgi:hypothetical protein